jgi:SPP1 gp7 family putative phage head morphogenesis protein
MAKAYDKDSGGGGGSGSLRDIYLKHGINLTRYSTHEARKLQGILDTANVQIKGIISKANGIETKEKYHRISKEIRRITNELTEKLDRQIELDFTDLAKEETQFVEKAMRSVNVTADFDLPAPKKIWAAASFKPYGKEIYETFDSYYKKMGDDVYKVWDTNVRAGYLAGLTAQQINRAVLGSVKDNIPGDMQKFRQSLERNTRTMVASLAETARDATYKENSKLFSGYRYVGTLDSRTCLVCGELDGKVFETLEELQEEKLLPPLHMNCRCLMLPEIKGMEGFDDDDERASVDGPVPANMTFNEWLKGQPETVQMDVLGPSRFAEYRKTENIEQFVVDGRVLSLEELQIKEQTKLGVLRSLYDEVRLSADFKPNNDVARDVIPEEILLEMKRLHKYDKGDGIEHFALMDKNGSLLGVQDGKDIGVINMSDETVSILKNSQKGAVIMAHTHSSSLSFSGHDLFELARFESLDSSRIIGYNGITYYMSIGDGIRPSAITKKDKKDFMKIYDDYLVDNLLKHFGRKDITIDVKAYYIASDTAKDIMKKYEWVYMEGKNGR